jgi:hypothetical protein
MAFHVVQRICGENVATEAAEYMEYNWRRGR